MNETIIAKAKNALLVLDPNNTAVTLDERQGAYASIKELVLLIIENE